MIMKRLLLPAILVLSLCFGAKAQYYQMANQAMQMLEPALSGSTAYKGFVEASYLKGVGSYKADFLEFTTTQGFSYSNWFFMGVGAGVDILFSHPNEDWGSWDEPGDFDVHHGSNTTSVMIPLYSDFRFNIGGSNGPSFFFDVRVGAAFLVGKDYVRIGNGYITNQEYFYLRPSAGLRVPVSKTSPKQAFNVGFTYQLLTSNYWNNWSRNVTLNSMGVNLSFEW